MQQESVQILSLVVLKKTDQVTTSLARVSSLRTIVSDHPQYGGWETLPRDVCRWVEETM